MQVYEEMKNRYGEMGINFLTEDQIHKYISDHLTPRLWFIKKHIRRIAKLEFHFPQENIDCNDISQIIEKYDELERKD